ncbi:hypothetical protein [Sporomusa sp. KB1]|jgi:hypothetical protein|uniref:hypothetical protein n=1 Tax=Sporomusa sp. KB1 TaxID=943346 RepID=UPI0011A76425|nr:hypothetical protein [Sporomusa sp. KB1]TWH49263.1 hypothetical protein Salpa_5473 [Sporomusa sp. KB1]
MVNELKNQIKTAIRRNSDRGFVPYSSCNRVCAEMMAVMQMAEDQAQVGDYQQAFDIYIMVLVETIKLIAHADDSSGAAGDVIHGCISEIDRLCIDVQEIKPPHFFDAIIKTVKKKAFIEWSELGYRLLKSAVYFVQNKKQAQKIYDLFPVLGTMYDDKEYPDKLLITHGILVRLEGREAADRYLLNNLHVTEIRMLVVENALAAKDYMLAEKLCTEALRQDPRGYFNKPAPWAYYLEQLYTETGNEAKREEMLRFILLHGDTSYFKKLKELYQEQGNWHKQREVLWQELAKSLMHHIYASLLAQEGETALLLEVVKQHKSYIVHYGKQLAKDFPQVTYEIFEEYILAEAKAATDRGKYKNVCRIIKNLSAAGGKTRALDIIESLNELYQRRPAMQEELAAIRKKI